MVGKWVSQNAFRWLGFGSRFQGGATVPPAVQGKPDDRQVKSTSAVPFLYAYTRLGTNLQITRAAPDRKWMSDTGFNFANRCLPLRVANQAGWFILNPTSVAIRWNGGASPKDLSVSSSNEGSIGYGSVVCRSHFGFGIVTWSLPVLFRTPAGYNLWVRGPANYFRDGLYPLEGIVETDWAIATFTMNWKVTRPDVTITFHKDEPICMITPLPRHLLESFHPRLMDLGGAPELEDQVLHWADQRDAINERKTKGESPPSEWQKHYYLGRTPKGDRFDDHQTNLRLREFTWE